MENSFQTSFIPKKPVTINNTVRKSAPVNLFMVFSVIIIVIVGSLAGGLFVYKNYLINQKAVLSASLAKVRASFEKDTIDELELYDKRVSTAKQVLSNHIVLSPLFALLGALTIPEVQYTKFTHESKTAGFSVRISGLATSYKSIAIQADTFNSAKGRVFKNIIFSNLTKNKDNKIGFDLEFTVDPSLLSYEKNIALENAQAGIVSPVPSIDATEPAPVNTTTPPTNQTP